MSKAIPLIARPYVVNHETEKIIMIDYILNNHDRHKGNLFYDLNSSILYTIDYSHLFTGPGRPILTLENIEKGMQLDSFLNTDILEKNNDAYELLCYSAGFEDTTVRVEVETIRSLINQDFLKDVFSSLPTEWTRAVEKDIINKLIEFIDIRVDNLDKIADLIISWGR